MRTFTPQVAWKRAGFMIAIEMFLSAIQPCLLRHKICCYVCVYECFFKRVGRGIWKLIEKVREAEEGKWSYALRQENESLGSIFTRVVFRVLLCLWSLISLFPFASLFSVLASLSLSLAIFWPTKHQHSWNMCQEVTLSSRNFQADMKPHAFRLSLWNG